MLLETFLNFTGEPPDPKIVKFSRNINYDVKHNNGELEGNPINIDKAVVGQSLVVVTSDQRFQPMMNPIMKWLYAPAQPEVDSYPKIAVMLFALSIHIDLSD